MKAVGLILAGGLATRMGGGDKCLRHLGGKSLLDHVIARAGGQVDAVALNANGDGARFAATGLPVLADDIGGFVGPLAGIVAGMEWAKAQGATHVFSVAADTPFFPLDLYQRLSDARADGGGHDIAIACSRDPDGRIVRQPTFGLWPVALADDLRAFLAAGDRKIILWAQQHRLALPVVGPSEGFFNINTEADLAEAEKMLGRAA